MAIGASVTLYSVASRADTAIAAARPPIRRSITLRGKTRNDPQARKASIRWRLLCVAKSTKWSPSPRAQVRWQRSSASQSAFPDAASESSFPVATSALTDSPVGGLGGRGGYLWAPVHTVIGRRTAAPAISSATDQRRSGLGRLADDSLASSHGEDADAWTVTLGRFGAAGVIGKSPGFAGDVRVSGLVTSSRGWGSARVASQSQRRGHGSG
jgi:hypothetical protein